MLCIDSLICFGRLPLFRLLLVFTSLTMPIVTALAQVRVHNNVTKKPGQQVKKANQYVTATKTRTNSTLNKKFNEYKFINIYDSNAGVQNGLLRKDTIFIEGSYLPRIYINRNADLSELGHDGYEAILLCVIQKLLRQDFIKDSSKAAPTQIRGKRPTEYEDANEIEQNSGAVNWAQNILSKANLLITPNRDTFLCVEINRAYYPRPLTTYTDSSYCFLLRKGNIQLVSDRLRPINVHGVGPTFQQKIFTLTAHDHRLAVKAKKMLNQPCPRTIQLIDQVRFRPRGVWVRYACVDDSNRTPPQKLEMVLPYNTLPNWFFAFNYSKK